MKPEAVIAQLTSAGSRTAFDITDVRREPDLPRLLVIRVGPRWARLPASEREAAAARWHRRWRESVRGGIVAVLDAASGRSLVSFDGQGRPRLKDGPMPP